MAAIAHRLDHRTTAWFPGETGPLSEIARSARDGRLAGGPIRTAARRRRLPIGCRSVLGAARLPSKYFQSLALPQVSRKQNSKSRRQLRQLYLRRSDWVIDRLFHPIGEVDHFVFIPSYFPGCSPRTRATKSKYCRIFGK